MIFRRVAHVTILSVFCVGDVCASGIGVQFVDCFGFCVFCHVWLWRKCQIWQKKIGVVNLGDWEF